MSPKLRVEIQVEESAMQSGTMVERFNTPAWDEEITVYVSANLSWIVH
jgi:hypothetical protein